MRQPHSQFPADGCQRTYRVVLNYADDELAGSGNDNANLVDRGFTVSTSAGTNETLYARNTYSWDQFDTIELTVRLAWAVTPSVWQPGGLCAQH